MITDKEILPFKHFTKMPTTTSGILNAIFILAGTTVQPKLDKIDADRGVGEVWPVSTEIYWLGKWSRKK